jgi:hypothetical protein
MRELSARINEPGNMRNGIIQQYQSSGLVLRNYMIYFGRIK